MAFKDKFKAYFQDMFGTSMPGERDHTLSITELRNILNYVQEGNFQRAEYEFFQLDTEHKTQCLDSLTLQLPPEKVLAWSQKYPQSAMGNFLAGVYYGHEAWRSSTGGDPEASRKQFLAHLNKAKELLEPFRHASPVSEQACERLIRIYMGLGNREQAYQCFDECRRINPANLWAYLHASELIQPKWGGGPREVFEFLHRLPQERVVRIIVELKLTYDSLASRTDLHGGSGVNLHHDARARVNRIDRELEHTALDSIFRFMAFNYLEILVSTLGMVSLMGKYGPLGRGYEALYPHGIR